MDRPLRVLDLFSGLNGWGDPFREAGHEVLAIDIDRRFTADAYLDIGDVAAAIKAVPWKPDIIFASPPCNSFSTGSMGKMWEHGTHPAPKRSERHPGGHPIAVEGMRLVSATLRLIAVLQPRFWVIENPRGRLRSLDLLAGIPRETVWYCHLGESRAKPTDLWGAFPDGLVLPPGCHNTRADHALDCCCRDHVAAPRGSRTGTQGGVSTEEAGRIPRELAERFRVALEPRSGSPASSPRVRRPQFLRAARPRGRQSRRKDWTERHRPTKRLDPVSHMAGGVQSLCP